MFGSLLFSFILLGVHDFIHIGVQHDFSIRWCSFRSSQMRRSHWNRSYLFFRRTRVYPLFYGESCSLFSIFGQFCWPVFYGECCSVFSIFGQFLLTSVFAYFLLAIALSCLTSICVFWLLLRYLQNFPVN